MFKPVVAITMGDPCGVGPEIVAKALSNSEIHSICRPLIVGDRSALERALEICNGRFVLQNISGCNQRPKHDPSIVPLFSLSALPDQDMAFGHPTVASGDAVFRYITRACDLCMSGWADAMVTAPINKEALNRAGHDYPGHTELLAELTGARNFVMMLAGERLRVALVTIHTALSQVPSLITFERVLSTIRITHNDLSRFFTGSPRIAVLALNPHCGEGGMFGTEEASVIAPAVAAARSEGIDAVGPLSADTLFHFAVTGAYDAVVCMYHDQGLIPLKLLHFDDGVNVTLGLPIIRTSVDHGTAYDIAGSGSASEASMVAAIKMAVGMAIKKRDGAVTA